MSSVLISKANVVKAEPLLCEAVDGSKRVLVAEHPAILTKA